MRIAALIFNMVQQQAAMLSFNDAFVLLGCIFLLIAPLVLIMRRPQSSRRKAPAPAGE